MPINRRYYNDPAYPTSVSRDVPAGEYSWSDVVYQSGRPVLDAELNLSAGAAEYANLLIAGKTLPSGFIRGQSSRDSFTDFMFPGPVVGLENQFALPKLTAFVAGMPVVVEYTNTITPGINLITLPVPTPTPGGSDIKRTDFVFLEVWRTLVAPSPRAMGSIEVVEPQTIAPGDTVSINAIPAGGPTVTFTANIDFAIGGSGAATASALAAAINASGLYPAYVAANTNGTNVITVSATFGGVLGNAMLMGASAPASTVISPMAGGANRLNKPSQSTVYHHGNVLSPSGVDLQDELVDPVLNIESAQRVQVQYRIRVFSEDPVTGVNPKTQPDGFSNPGVLAQGAKGFPVATYRFVPADNTTVIAPSDATAYGFVDNGLFVAGDGSQAAATALGTVDGFVYAIPVCFVFRRSDSSSSSGFNPGLTANSGLPLVHALPIMNPFLSGNPVFPSGVSDRPDGLFADIIAPTDVLDLRRHVTPPGYDFGSELKYQLQSLLDKKTATWQLDGSDFGEIGNGSGDQSTYPMFCDEIGRTDTPSGNLIRGFDHVARRLGAQNVVEKVVFEIYPDPLLNPPGLVVTKATPGDVTWCEGDILTVDFGALDPNSLQNWTGGAGLTNVGAVWPAGTKVTDVLSVYHDDGSSLVSIDQQVQLTTVAGVGTEVIELTLDANASMVDAPAVFGPPVPPHLVVADPAVDDGSVRRIFVELEITYPTGAGLTGTPDITVTPDAAAAFYPPYAAGPILEADNTQRPADMDATWVPNPKFRSGYREVKLEQRTTLQTDYIVSRDSFTVVAPRRFFWSGMLANGLAPDTSTTFGSSDRRIVLDAGAPAAGQSAVQVDYKTQDPVPDAGAIGYQLYVYYRSNAPQTAGTSGLVPTTLLPATLTVDPMSISAEVWTGQTGKGSTDLGFPYESPLDQIATTPFPGGPFPGMQPKEWYFSALAEVSVADFSASTGILSLHSFVQVDGTNPIQLGDALTGRGPLKDAELRAYYDMANPGGYKPTTMAQPLFGPTRHKVFQPMLVRSTVDTLLFRKGELLLMVLSRFAELDPDNKIAFTDNPSIRTAAALYRTRNLLLTVGD